MKVYFAAVIGFLFVKTATLLVNLRAFPTLRSRSTVLDLPAVSVLVPARNEAERLAVTLPAIVAQEAAEVLVLDDESTDGTAEVARRLTTGQRHVRLVEGRAAPAGWVGKSWACHQLADLAASPVLAFCDADIALRPGAIRAAVLEMQRQEADVFSVFPRQRTVRLGERLLVPLVDDALLSLLPHPLLRIDVPSAATANGSLLLITRSAYERLGGFESVKAQIVEDVALARRTRRLGLRLGLALGGELVGARMYDGYGEAVRGLARGLVSVVGSRRGLTGAVIWQVLTYTAPVVLAVRNRRWTAAIVLAAVDRLLVEAKTGRRSWGDVVLVPLTPLATVPVLAQALRRRQTWKGRTVR